MKKKALIFRASPAFGDIIFISFVPKQLKEKGYEHITIATWKSNKFIWDNNLYVDDFIYIDDIEAEFFEDYRKKWEQEYEFFDFRYTVEYNYFDKSHQPEYKLTERRKRAKNKNYYRDSLSKYNLGADKGELYLSDDEKAIIDKYKNQNRKRILWQPIGGGRNKIITYVIAYINEIYEKNPDIEHWICGHQHYSLVGCKGIVRNMIDMWTPRQTLSMIPIFNLVIGPESFCINAAGTFDIPTLTFFSHSKPENLNKYFKNAYSVCPTCQCHPCYLLITDFRGLLDLKQRKFAREQEQYCLYRKQRNHFLAAGFRCCIDIDHKKVIKQILDIIK